MSWPTSFSKRAHPHHPRAEPAARHGSRRTPIDIAHSAMLSSLGMQRVARNGSASRPACGCCAASNRKRPGSRRPEAASGLRREIRGRGSAHAEERQSDAGRSTVAGSARRGAWWVHRGRASPGRLGVQRGATRCSSPRRIQNPVLAMRDFLFELNNATRVAAFEEVEAGGGEGMHGNVSSEGLRPRRRGGGDRSASERRQSVVRVARQLHRTAAGRPTTIPSISRSTDNSRPDERPRTTSSKSVSHGGIGQR